VSHILLKRKKGKGLTVLEKDRKPSRDEPF
jgi:hypothetical protein